MLIPLVALGPAVAVVTIHTAKKVEVIIRNILSDLMGGKKRTAAPKETSAGDVGTCDLLI
jgi:hypothetical protein